MASARLNAVRYRYCSMSDIADRYRRVAAAFTWRAEAVPPTAWDNAAPCDGWVARDIVAHMVEWISGMLQECAAIELPRGPSVADDPAGAWRTMSDGLQRVLDDPAQASRELSHEQLGTMPLEDAVSMTMINDVFLHAWDLARATGLDETLDPLEVASLLAAMEPMDEMLRQSGHFGPRVVVPPTADAQTKLLAFIGRHP